MGDWVCQLKTDLTFEFSWSDLGNRWLAVFAVIAFACGFLVLWLTASPRAWQAAVPRLVEQVVDANFGIGYAVSVADINRDGKTDIVAINPTQAVWYENPSLEEARHHGRPYQEGQRLCCRS